MKEEPKEHFVCDIHGLPITKLDPYGNVYCSKCYTKRFRHPTLQALVNLIREWMENPEDTAPHAFRMVRTNDSLSERDTDLNYPQFRICTIGSDCLRCFSPRQKQIAGEYCEEISRIKPLEEARYIGEVTDLLVSFGFSTSSANRIISEDYLALEKMKEHLEYVRDIEKTRLKKKRSD